MILVAGGTGRLGTAVVRRLLARRLAVRVLTRDPTRAAHLGDRVEIVQGDVRDADSLPRAMAGASVVVSAVHGFAGPGRVSPATVDRAGNINLIDAARTAGAEMVLMSLVGAAPESPIELFRAKHDAERHLRAGTAPWTIIRSTSFVELWAELLSRGIVFGRGTNPVNFVAVEDVAAAVEIAVTDERLRGEIVEVGGAENLTLNQLAEICRELTGRPTTVRHIPQPVLRVAAALARQPRLALEMDIADMTFDRSRRQSLDVGPTDLRAALAAAGPHLT